MIHFQVAEGLRKVLHDAYPTRVHEYSKKKLTEIMDFIRKNDHKEPNLKTFSARIMQFATFLHEANREPPIHWFDYCSHYRPDMPTDEANVFTQKEVMVMGLKSKMWSLDQSIWEAVVAQLRETQKEKAINDEDVGTEFVKKAFAEPPPPQMMAP